MMPIKMSDLAYKEFKKFIEKNEIGSNTFRIFLDGNGCGGPIFNISLGEQTSEDLLSPIGELIFLVDKNLFSQFGGFTLQCSEENGTDAFTILPVIQPEENNCSSCSSCSSCN
ncbi:HesB-like protein [Clostridium sp. Marseille-Q2269]|uniref:HesB-like protein n=1 Tax=Clostridium sp. Marseille-Q2269 TaxID=2942205 RepID=UPI002072FD82|nr:HesB-like protein [Clostridium sp. Marseille-Q2269]